MMRGRSLCRKRWDIDGLVDMDYMLLCTSKSLLRRTEHATGGSWSYCANDHNQTALTFIFAPKNFYGAFRRQDLFSLPYCSGPAAAG